MTWNDVLSMVDVHPTIKFVVGIFVVVLGSKAFSSESEFAKRLWGLKKIYTWWKGRQERAADLEERLSERRTQALWDEIARVDEARKSDIARLESEVARLKALEQDKYEYIIWVTQIFRNIKLWATNKGLVLPKPEFLDFETWNADRRRNSATLDHRPDLEEG